MRRSGEITNRTAIGFVSRVSLLCLAISSWWIAALITQANHGSRVLSFSESVEAVSRTSTASEVLRGMGHWLNYINAHTAIATTSTIQFMANHWLIISGFSLVALAMMGISISRTRASQFASAFVFAGLVLAVGVHPIEDSALFMRPLAENTESFIALALRSSTRAAPLMLLGLAIGLALLLEKLRFSMRIQPLLGLATAGLILFNFAPIRTGSLFDNEMQRDESLPRDFLDAATQLNALGHRGRVLSFPGSEFGIYDWGYTMDPPQIGFIEQPLLTRDLLPLGGNASMDLFYAFDDGLQTGTVTARAIAPLSRLLGASDIWLSIDHKSEQYNTVTPEELQALFAQTDQLEAFVKNAGTYLYSVKQPGALAQMKQTIVLIDGSGDGIVSAASAGAISGHEAVLYASNFKDEELAKLLDRSSMIFVTDSNRTQARQWSGSRDSRGATESADGIAIVEEPRQRSADTRHANSRSFPWAYTCDCIRLWQWFEILPRIETRNVARRRPSNGMASGRRWKCD
jgi:arabinofuranan 3-O-arabinosyltransferase